MNIPQDLRTRVQLIQLGAKQSLTQGRALTQQCMNATSLLPLPGSDHVLVVTARGELQELRTAGSQASATPTPITIDEQPLAIHRLIGVVRGARPLRVLVVATQKREDRRWFWQLTLHGNHATATRESSESELDKTLFERYMIPQCFEHEKQCLTITNERDPVTHQPARASLDVEAQRGKETKPFTTLDSTRLLDAVWSPAGDRTALVLAETDPPCTML